MDLSIGMITLLAPHSRKGAKTLGIGLDILGVGIGSSEQCFGTRVLGEELTAPEARIFGEKMRSYLYRFVTCVTRVLA